jgi:mono/diheme cytochrome c family protein
MGRWKMGWRNAVLLAMIMAACAAARAQAPAYKLGTTPTPEQIRAWDITIGNDGKGLPPGKGTADEGEKIYNEKCAACHGINGTGGEAPALAASTSGHPPYPLQVPFAPVVWDYIRRAMPMLIGPGTLKPDEVYSLTAYLFYKNNLIKENDVLDAQTLPKVKIPTHEAFVPPAVKPWKP